MPGEVAHGVRLEHGLDGDKTRSAPSGLCLIQPGACAIEMTWFVGVYKDLTGFGEPALIAEDRIRFMRQGVSSTLIHGISTDRGGEQLVAPW